MERTSNKSQLTKLTLEKTILPPLLSGFELATFRSRIRRSANELSRLPYNYASDRLNALAEDDRTNVDFFLPTVSVSPQTCKLVFVAVN